jgi:hypothetical protein
MNALWGSGEIDAMQSSGVSIGREGATHRDDTLAGTKDFMSQYLRPAPANGPDAPAQGSPGQLVNRHRNALQKMGFRHLEHVAISATVVVRRVANRLAGQAES